MLRRLVPQTGFSRQGHRGRSGVSEHGRAGYKPFWRAAAGATACSCASGAGAQAWHLLMDCLGLRQSHRTRQAQCLRSVMSRTC